MQVKFRMDTVLSILSSTRGSIILVSFDVKDAGLKKPILQALRKYSTSILTFHLQLHLVPIQSIVGCPSSVYSYDLLGISLRDVLCYISDWW